MVIALIVFGVLVPSLYLIGSSALHMLGLIKDKKNTGNQKG